MNPLPPQAYTKDTLLKAYTWLQNQSDNIKELAMTPDILVSLFLKAQRNGDQALQTPSIQNFKNELKSLAGIMGEFDQEVAPKIPASIPKQNTASTNQAQNQQSTTLSHQATNQQNHPAGAQVSPSSIGSNKASEPLIQTSAIADLLKNSVPPQRQQSHSENQSGLHSGAQNNGHAGAQNNSHSGLQNNNNSGSQNSNQTFSGTAQTSAQSNSQVLESLDSESRDLIREVKRQLNLSSETEALRVAIKLGSQKVKDLSK